jgi:uncharacterized membrane protein
MSSPPPSGSGGPQFGQRPGPGGPGNQSPGYGHRSSGPGEPPPQYGQRPGPGGPGERPPQYGQRPGPGGAGGPGGPGDDLRGITPQQENDKLISALCYIFWFLVPIIILVTDMKDSRFAKVHAYQGIVWGAVGIAFYILYGIIWIILSAVIPFIGCILWVGYFLPFALSLYFAYLVFSKGAVVLPGLTDATKAVFKDL